MVDQFTRPCDGTCGDDSLHNAHLTAAGRARFAVEPEGNLFQGADTVLGVLGELAGYSSLCWKDVSGERVFDTERAERAVLDADARIKELKK